MKKLGSLVRWCFGLQALLVLVIPFRLLVAFRLYGKLRQAPPEWLHGHPNLLLPTLLTGALATSAIPAVVGIASGVAWWALKKGWRSARIWALVASVLSLARLNYSSLIGLCGLAVFWRKDSVTSLADSAVQPRHMPGDGTHKWMEVAAPLAMYGLWVWAWSLWSHWGDLQGLPHQFRSSNLPGLLLFMTADYSAMVLHEAGHLFAGWGSDMVLRGFQLGPLAGTISAGRWRFRFNPAGLLGGGAVSMAPTQLKHLRGRKLLMVLGGPVASLLTGSIGIVFALGAHGSAWESNWVFLAMFGTIGCLGFLFNLTPLRPEGAYSDGAQIYQLMRGGTWADRHLAGAMVSSSLTTSLRPRDYDGAILERAASGLTHGLDGLHFQMFLAMHHLDDGRFQEGIADWRRAVEQDPQATEKLSADTFAELAFYEAAIANDLERALGWWQRVEGKGKSRKEVDYWKGRTALLIAQGQLDEAALAFHHADDFAQKLPEGGAYEYDRWCVDVLRRKLNATDLARLNHVVATDAVVAPVVVK